MSNEGSSGSGGSSGNVFSIRRPVDEVERLMTALEVAKHLGCSESKIYKAAVDKRVPPEERLPSYLPFGSLRRFRLSEVEAWLQRQRPRSPNRNRRSAA